MRNQHVGRELVGGIDKAAGPLKPGLKTPGAREKVPAEDDRREADAGIGAAAYGLCVGLALINESLLVGVRGIGLPERHDVGAKLELAAQDACTKRAADGLAHLKAEGEEVEVGAIADSCAAVDERAVFPTPGLPDLGNRIIDDGGERRCRLHRRKFARRRASCLQPRHPP